MKKEIKLPLISIIMPVYNGEKYIRIAIDSIINQSYKNYELIVIDGNSSDNTINIVEEYSKYITYFVSEKDTGMYNAINKGMKISKGEIVCWLNSDDYYFPNALETVASTFVKFEDIDWITGRKVIINENNQIIKVGVFKNFFKYFIKKGFYRSDLLGTITQETTFWRRNLIYDVGLLDESLKVASDYDLWIKFASTTELYSINTLLGAFRIHKGQLSENKDRYYDECYKIKKIRNKTLVRVFGVLMYFFSMLSSKNKISITDEGKIIKNSSIMNFE